MIEPAIRHSATLQHEFRKVWFEEKYKFYNNSDYYKDFVPDEDTWNQHQFVSLGSNGQVIGYIGYSICRTANYAHSLGAINFSSGYEMTFATDLKRVLEDIFEKFNFNKLAFSVVIGNPAEKAYDRLVAKYGGRIVGVWKQDTILHDNKLYDVKQYEILKSDYEASRLQRRVSE